MMNGLCRLETFLCCMTLRVGCTVIASLYLVGAVALQLAVLCLTEKIRAALASAKFFTYEAVLVLCWLLLAAQIVTASLCLASIALTSAGPEPHLRRLSLPFVVSAACVSLGLLGGTACTAVMLAHSGQVTVAAIVLAVGLTLTGLSVYFCMTCVWYYVEEIALERLSSGSSSISESPPPSSSRRRGDDRSERHSRR